MKNIRLLEPQDYLHTKVLIKTVLETGGANGLQVSDIRKRCKLLDELESASGDLWSLEDADYEYLKTLVTDFRFTKAENRLLEIIDSVLNPVESTSAQRSHIKPVT